MKNTMATILMMTAAMGIATGVLAKSEKKNPPKSGDVEKMIKDAGGDHFPEDMKVNKVGPIEVGDTYYHAYCGSLQKGGYRVILFDNSPAYLGYYATEFEASDYEEGAVLLDSGESDEEGNTDWYYIRIGNDGPKEKVSIDGIPTPFVKNKKSEEEKKAEATKAATTSADNGGLQPEYREWSIRAGAKEMKFTAIYIKQAGGKVYLKEQKRGITKDFSISKFSKEDQAYIKQFK